MSDDKKPDWVAEAEVLLIGAWDALGKLGPKLVREVRSLRKSLDEHKKLLAEAVADIEAAAASEDGMDGSVADKWRDIMKEKVIEKMLCPRREQFPGPVPDFDFWQGDDSCSFCGSLNPVTLFARIEKGDVRLGPTDKSYKLYVHNDGGMKFPQWHSRKCPDVMTCDVRTCAHWTKGEQDVAKFYFMHMSIEQQERFITLYNEKKLKFGEPGGFYVLPFFMKKVA